MEIQKPYDSHVHFLATGECASLPNLRSLQHPAEIQNVLWPKEMDRGEWKYAFGWDENQWQGEQPTRQILDQFFPEQPVLLSRCDGHSSWLNTAGLKKLSLMNKSENFSSTMIPRGADGYPVGLLRETPHVHSLLQLPAWTKTQQKKFLKKSEEIFHKGGITHVREMTGTVEMFSLLQEMEEQKDLLISVDFNFVCDSAAEIDSLLSQIKSCKSSQLVKTRGVKIFYDGSLGSETALLSMAYPNQEHSGIKLWDADDLKSVIKKTFAEKLEICFHTIGDQAAHDLVLIAREMSGQGHLGRFNFEHVSVLRPETIQMMKSLHARCHMQPLYWMSDQKWIKEKLGPLHKFAFPWEALRRAQIDLQFGSDSPIEVPSLWKNHQALIASSRNGIPKFGGEFAKFHSSPYTDVVSSTVILDDNGEVTDLHFNGMKI